MEKVLEQGRYRYTSHISNRDIDIRATNRQNRSMDEPQIGSKVSIIEPYFSITPLYVSRKLAILRARSLADDRNTYDYRFTSHRTCYSTIDRQAIFLVSPSINRAQIFDSRATVLNRRLDSRATKIRLTGHNIFCKKLKSHRNSKPNLLTNCFNKKNKTRVVFFKEIE